MSVGDPFAAVARFPIDELERRGLNLIQRTSGHVAECLEEHRPRVYGLHDGFLHLPLEQAVRWGTHDESWLWRLGVATTIAHWHFRLHDQLVDTGNLTPMLSIAADVCLLALTAELRDLGSTVDLATLHLAQYGDYADVVSRELRRAESLAAFTSADLERLGAKAAPGRVLHFAVADRAQRLSAAEPLVRAHDLVCAGRQLLDDLADAEEDYKHGAATYPLLLARSNAAAVRQMDPQPSQRLSLELSWDEVDASLNLSGAAEATAHLAAVLGRKAAAFGTHADAGAVVDIALRVTAFAEERRRALTRRREGVSDELSTRTAIRSGEG
jgi:hypothetical protein